MKNVLIIISLIIFNGCYGLQIPKSTQDPNDPNRGPILINAGELKYPKLAWEVSLEGIVEVEIDIDTSGIVYNVRVVKRKFNADAVYTVSNKFVYVKDIVDEPTISFYKQCKYMPALSNGKPINCTIRTGMNYKIVK
jgi:hypothetical protein